MQSVSTQTAPKAIGPYSQAVRIGNHIFVSGQLGISPETGQFAAADTSGQAEQALLNIESILRTAGGTMCNVAAVTIYLTSMPDFTAVNEVYSKHFTPPYPARACVEVSALPKCAKVEISAIAVLEDV